MKASRPARGSIEVLLLSGWLVFPGSCCCRGLINDTDRDRVIHSVSRGVGGGGGGGVVGGWGVQQEAGRFERGREMCGEKYKKKKSW